MVLYSSGSEQIKRDYVIGFTKVDVIVSDSSKCWWTEVVFADFAKWAWELNSANLSLVAFSVGCCSLRYASYNLCENSLFKRL